MLREQGLDYIPNYVFQSSKITFEIFKNLLHLCSHFHTLFINIFPEPSNLKLDMFPILLYIKQGNTLTLFQVGLKIYVSWWGGAFKAPPMFSLKMTYLGPKNNKTIIPHIFEDLMEGLEPKHPPMVPQKTYFFATRQKILKIGSFQKSRFLGGQRGVFGFLNIQNGFIYQYL